MEDDFDPGHLDHFVKSIQLRNVGDNKDVQLLLRLVRICFANFLSFFSTADGCHDIVPLLEESLKDVSWLQINLLSWWSYLMLALCLQFGLPAMNPDPPVYLVNSIRLPSGQDLDTLSSHTCEKYFSHVCVDSFCLGIQ